MTELSPAAQAVLDAWNKVLDPEVTCLTRDPEREALAAALRAAANELIPRLPGDTAFERGYVAGIGNARHQLRAFAAELQN